MGSFKLEKSGNIKEATTGAGALLIILGGVVALLVHPGIGLAMVAVGVLALLAGKFAKS